MSESSHNDGQQILPAPQLGHAKRRVIVFKPLQEMPIYLTQGPAKPPSETRSAQNVTQPIVIARQLSPCSARTIGTPDAGPLEVLAPHPPSPSPPCAGSDDGSWKQRKTLHLLCNHGADSPSMMSRPAARQAGAQTNYQCQPANSAASSADKAWRSRFVHKWRREQARRGKICNDDMWDDPWHADLHMLQAANVHPDLQMPMPDHDCYPVGTSPSPLLSIDDDLGCVLEADYITPEPVNAVRTATKLQSALSEAASKARQLLKHQVNLCSCLDSACYHNGVC